jgi:hypothetical protein
MVKTMDLPRRWCCFFSGKSHGSLGEARGGNLQGIVVSLFCGSLSLSANPDRGFRTLWT